MDEKLDNPYQSPESRQPKGDPPIGGGNAILVLCIAFALFGVLSLVTFVVQANYETPMGERFISIQPLWVFMHLVRGIALMCLAFYLWRYAWAVRQHNKLGGPPSQLFWIAHARVWNCGAWALITITIYSIVFIAMQWLHPYP